MRRNTVNSASDVKKLPSPSCSTAMLSYNLYKILAIWQHVKRLLSICAATAIWELQELTTTTVQCI